MALGLHATPCAATISVVAVTHEVGVSEIEYAMHGDPAVPAVEPATTHFTSPLVEVGSYATPAPFKRAEIDGFQTIPSFE